MLLKNTLAKCNHVCFLSQKAFILNNNSAGAFKHKTSTSKLCILCVQSYLILGFIYFPSWWGKTPTKNMILKISIMHNLVQLQLLYISVKPSRSHIWQCITEGSTFWKYFLTIGTIRASKYWLSFLIIIVLSLFFSLEGNWFSHSFSLNKS